MSKRLDKAAACIAAAESGNGEQFLYQEAALLIDAEMQARPALTQRDVAAEMKISKSQVGRLLQELSRVRGTGKTFQIDWKSGRNSSEDKDARALKRAEPNELVAAALEAIEKAPPKQQKKLLEKVTDPSTVGGRHIANKVAERETEKKRKEEEREPAAITGIPLPAMWASISVGIDKWVRDMSRFEDDDLDELAQVNPEGAAAIGRTTERLHDQTQRWLSRLKRMHSLKVVGDGNVIEGVASRR